jgi:hypothetical protein
MISKANTNTGKNALHIIMKNLTWWRGRVENQAQARLGRQDPKVQRQDHKKVRQDHKVQRQDPKVQRQDHKAQQILQGKVNNVYFSISCFE